MDDIVKIKVKNYMVGLVGLKQALRDMAPEFASKSDADIGRELINRLKMKNYIPPRAVDDYSLALVREFRKFVGQPYQEDSSSGLKIKVLGPGCAQCDRLEMAVYEVLNELNLPAEVEHVTDVKEIGQSGVFGTPALIINGQVLSVGSVPPKARIRQWIEEAGK